MDDKEYVFYKDGNYEKKIVLSQSSDNFVVSVRDRFWPSEKGEYVALKVFDDLGVAVFWFERLKEML